MTKEDKELLFKDLCARLPYGVNIDVNGIGGKLRDINVVHLYYDTDEVQDTISEIDFFGDGDKISIEHIKPYLRPMSSMTSKEWVEFCDCSVKDEASWVITRNHQKLIPVQNREDYLNSKHFDYRGLIKKGLAIEAPEGMYK